MIQDTQPNGVEGHRQSMELTSTEKALLDVANRLAAFILRTEDGDLALRPASPGAKYAADGSEEETPSGWWEAVSETLPRDHRGPLGVVSRRRDMCLADAISVLAWKIAKTRTDGDALVEFARASLRERGLPVTKFADLDHAARVIPGFEL